MLRSSNGCREMNNFGTSDMVSPLRRVLVKKPGAAMAAADPKVWHYSGPLSKDLLHRDHAALIAILENYGAEILYLEQDPLELADAVFTQDASLVTPYGAVICRMGKTLRRGEQELHQIFYIQQHVPVLGTIESPGTVEAGDCVWLDAKTLLVGLGFRTNESGMSQLQEILSPHQVDIHSFDLPVYHGDAACLHLMSILSMLDHNLALVCRSMLPVRLLNLFIARKIECVPACEEEFQSSGTLSTNVLALGPRQCVVVDGFSETHHRLREAGCTLYPFSGTELCLKAEGGPTCLTRPVLRGT